ncbi:polyphosphate kinase 2 [Pseudoroseicyclus tamaricis]|uniref:ADP/GDP-polyphosphate phosphotransferase n=1 Tax=Pseudoroseicyclus tamaricis TaxID=2705421 RepID=A0A6B2K2F6_9RHOB|nr:polyphosphate kinase 2 [Pseudoroseicyclus tamaricis]NDV00636.1 polyphosphate kinase 2 [Pseudoroseicyclus tamaricis]
MPLPFDGAISDYLKTDAPQQVRDTLKDADKDDVTNPDWPYDERLSKKKYKKKMKRLQRQLVRLQASVKARGDRVAIVFEGRDAAGKGGSIKAFTENLNPRGARVVALPKPTEQEATQWYFQRYVAHLPAAGEIVLFDRSWYNRGVVEKVFDFCTEDERARWFEQVGPFEKLLVDEGITLYKFWLNVGRATQLDRFLDRETEALKQWKLSWIDVEGLKRWDGYSEAIEETLFVTHTTYAPWTIVRADDKRRARINLIRTVLHGIDYDGKDEDEIGAVDECIAGGPELWTRA